MQFLLQSLTQGSDGTIDFPEFLALLGKVRVYIHWYPSAPFEHLIQVGNHLFHSNLQDWYQSAPIDYPGKVGINLSRDTSRKGWYQSVT